MPVSSSSSSVGEDVSRSTSISIRELTKLSSSADSWAARADRYRAPSAVSTRFHFRTLPGSAILLHRGPETRRMQFGHVDLHGLPTSGRHHGLAFFVHLHHELGRVRFA